MSTDTERRMVLLLEEQNMLLRELLAQTPAKRRRRGPRCSTAEAARELGLSRTTFLRRFCGGAAPLLLRAADGTLNRSEVEAARRRMSAL